MLWPENYTRECTTPVAPICVINLSQSNQEGRSSPEKRPSFTLVGAAGFEPTSKCLAHFFLTLAGKGGERFRKCLQ